MAEEQQIEGGAVDYPRWAWRVIVLGLAGVIVLVVLGHFGVLADIGQLASGLLGIALGVAALLGALIWTEKR